MASENTLPPATPTALQNVCSLWTEEFGRRFGAELESAVREYEYGILGGPAFGADDIEILKTQRSSLPAMWAAFWRPLPSGNTGAELAGDVKKLRGGVLGAALARIQRARALLGDVIALDGDVATVREAVSGELLRVQVQPQLAPGLRRHMRIFGVIAELREGLWVPPSVLIANRRFAHVDPALLSSRLGAEVEGLGHAPGDEAGRLLRWAGVAHGLLRRLAADSEQALLEEERDASRPELLTEARDQTSARALIARALDEVQPALGATPRDRMKRADGPQAVEDWLAAIERRGLSAGPAFLDLDVIRDALGLPRVTSG